MATSTCPRVAPACWSGENVFRVYSIPTLLRDRSRTTCQGCTEAGREQLSAARIASHVSRRTKHSSHSAPTVRSTIVAGSSRSQRAVATAIPASAAPPTVNARRTVERPQGVVTCCGVGAGAGFGVGRDQSKRWRDEESQSHRRQKQASYAATDAA